MVLLVQHIVVRRQPSHTESNSWGCTKPWQDGDSRQQEALIQMISQEAAGSNNCPGVIL